METVWDAVIVGAGPAGCAAAYDLLTAGRRVLLLDREEFPRPKACAGGLTMKAVRALRYGIEPVVRRWVNRIVLEQDSSRAVTVGRRAPVCAMTVREELDEFCLRQTVARGAVFRRVPPLLAVEPGADRVVLRFAEGEAVAGRFVLGADGVHSRMRALSGAASWFRTGFALEANVDYRGPDEAFPLTFDFAPVPGGYGWLFPRDNHVNVGLYVEGAGRLDRGALLRYVVARCGPGREVSRPVGQFLGLGAAAYRPAPGTRVLLAGDAAGFVDPLTGEGIYGAIRSGQAAAAAIDRALGLLLAGSGNRAEPSLQPRETESAGGASLSASFLAATKTLRSDLEIAEHAARRFYADPARGFRLLRMPMAPSAVLRTYSDGLSLRRLRSGVHLAGRVAGWWSGA